MSDMIRDSIFEFLEEWFGKERENFPAIVREEDLVNASVGIILSMLETLHEFVGSEKAEIVIQTALIRARK